MGLKRTTKPVDDEIIEETAASAATTAIPGVSIEAPVADPDTGVQRAPSFDAYSSRLSASNTLTGKGAECYATLVKTFNQGNYVTESRAIEGIVEYLVVKNTVRDTAVILMFAETYRRYDNRPVSAYAKRVVKDLKDNCGYGTTYFLQTIVLDPSDYDRIDRMQLFVKWLMEIEALNADPNFQNLNARDLLGNGRFQISTNPDEIRKFIDDNSPHGVPARCDYGILLQREVETTEPLTGRREKTPVPLLAVSGYTKILDGQMNTPMERPFMAIPTITDVVVQRAPDFRIAAIALPIAITAFYNNAMWCSPYTNLGKNGINLGALELDHGKYSTFKDANQVNMYIAQRFFPAPMPGASIQPTAVAIEVAEGRARPLHLDSFITRDFNEQRKLVHMLSKFFQQPELPIPENNPVLGWTKVTGICSAAQSGQLCDSRNVDYLNLAPLVGPSSPEFINMRRLLTVSSDPYENFSIVKQLKTDARALYVTNTIIIDSNLSNWLAGCIMNSGIMAVIDQPLNGMINVFGAMNGMMQSNMLCYNPYMFGYQTSGLNGFCYIPNQYGI